MCIRDSLRDVLTTFFVFLRMNFLDVRCTILQNSSAAQFSSICDSFNQPSIDNYDLSQVTDYLHYYKSKVHYFIAERRYPLDRLHLTRLSAIILISPWDFLSVSGSSRIVPPHMNIGLPLLIETCGFQSQSVAWRCDPPVFSSYGFFQPVSSVFRILCR